MAKRAQLPKPRSAPRGRVASVSRRNSRWLLLAVVAAVVVAAIGVILLATSAAHKPVEATSRVGAGTSWGPAEAKVTMLGFSDFGCSACRTFALNQGQQLRAAYEQGGQVRFEFKPFVLNWATTAAPANAALCAADQGKFWDYHDVLFQQQGTSASAFSTAMLKQYATQLGLDTARFNRCVDGSEHYNELKAAQTDGQRRGVNATPTFFINGEPLQGAQPFDVFQAALDALLRS